MTQPKTTGTLYGLVLAGGRSSRMGQDKAFLSWHNHQPLYQHAVDQLQRADVEHILLSGAQFDDYRLAQTQITTIHDIIPACGPLSGIHAALAQTNDNDRLMVIPVDMPAITPAALSYLCTQSTQTCDVMHYTDYHLPVLLKVSPLLRNVIDIATNSNDPKKYALWRLYQQLNTLTIEPPSAMIASFGNANTPEQFQQLLAQNTLSS